MFPLLSVLSFFSTTEERATKLASGGFPLFAIWLPEPPHLIFLLLTDFVSVLDSP